MIFEYISNSQSGVINSKLTREEVRKIFKVPFVEFSKTKYSENTTDAFRSIQVHAYYEKNSNKLIGLEIYQPNRLIYKTEFLILGQGIDDLIKDLKTKKIPFAEDCIGIDLEKGAIGVFAQHKGERYMECTSVYVDLLQTNSLIIKA